MTRKRKKRKSHAGLIVFFVILCLLIGGAGGGYFWYSSSLKPVSSTDEKIAIEIAQGDTQNIVIDKLEAAGLIQSKLATKIYTKLNEFPRYVGTFELSTSMSTQEIFAKLADPNNALQSFVSVTIPEGKWAKDIATILANSLPHLNRDELLRLWNDDAYINQLAQVYPFIDPTLLTNDQYFVKLEGYLFPETYHIDLNMNEDQVTRMLLDQFGAVIAQFQPQIDASQYNLQEILTLASIIQFESGNPEDMPDISGVFHNRLNSGMPLGSSVTVCYALYDQFESSEQCETNTDIQSPYNTYLNAGLPIGPILNPGRDAISAALNPAQNDYLYFVADIYGDGKTHFARTLEEHEANIDRFNLRLE
ncbi:endolytic transglycosylase MltG [Allobaculum stercoricanis]|uniref:endolytic transglycosylase MltG n=1 Tax=Allobaculum stercoricanis TaxID=174709 RepID=UPI002942808F|nr:endolytic transglycosylase MltG [Allobaculum stercoricanis]